MDSDRQHLRPWIVSQLWLKHVSRGCRRRNMYAHGYLRLQDLGSMVRDIKDLANTSRREYAIPSDFETVLRRFNLPISSLVPHLSDPRTKPSTRIYKEELGESEAILAHFKGVPLPFLGKELSGRVDKTTKHYIPPSFPDFPSQHTYKFTSEDDGRVRNTQKIREDAAENAQQGEEALRRLVRASKMRKQKEVKLLAEGDDQGRERFRLWQAAMKGAISDRVDQHGNRDSEISDHSMIVNGDSIFARKDTSRHTDRPNPINNTRK